MPTLPRVQLFVASSAFEHQQRIPRRFTCDGEDVSPQLSWHGVPDDAQALALVMEDPDAPRGTFTHWVYYNLAGTLRELPEGVEKTERPTTGGEQGVNDFGNIGYNGPCPPPGPAHHYHLILYALDRPVDLPPGASKPDLDEAMRDHIIGLGELIGLYGRGSR
jgi:Raf kinase inhibitor-like YbhB/YbcL family protein